MSCCLSLENLLLKRGDRILCKDINIALEHKDKIAILGHNGSGKTTLLETIAGLIKIESGTIEIFHKKLLTEADFKDIRSKIGYLLQDSDDHFLSPIALDDIAFTLLSRGVKPAEARSEAEKMMMTLGIEPLANKVVYHLSGGEKKLIALAGILIAKPDLLLLDEPTAGLDYDAQTRLVQLLRDTDKTTIVVSHDWEFLESIAKRFFLITPNGLSEIADFQSFITHRHDGLMPHTHRADR